MSLCVLCGQPSDHFASVAPDDTEVVIEVPEVLACKIDAEGDPHFCSLCVIKYLRDKNAKEVN